jgi:WD40 repeat protein
VGATNLIAEDSKFTQIELDDRRLLLGTGAFLNYALETETSERLETASEFEMAKARDLPALGEAFHVNFGRSLWTKSDEDGSFSREAEKAFFQLGLKAWFWAPWQSRGHDDPISASTSTKRGRESLDPMVRRIQAIGGEFRLLDPSGAPPSSNQPTLSPRRSGNTQEDPNSAGMNPSKFPLGAVTAGGRLVSIHAPNEVRFWSADMKTATSVRTPMIEEMLTAAAISPDGRSLATSGLLGVRMWDADAAKPSGILPMDGCQEYHCPVFSPDGTLVAAGGKDGRARIWDVRTGRLLGSTVDGGWSIRLVRRDEPVTTRHRGNMVSALAFSADGRLLAEGHAGGELKIWDLTDRAKPKKIKSLDMDLGLIWRLKFLHEGRELAVLNAKGSFRVLDGADWKVSRKGDNTLPATTSALFDPSGETVVTSHAGGKVVRVNLGTGAFEKDVTVEGVSFGVLVERDGKAFLLGESWKPVGF